MPYDALDEEQQQLFETKLPIKLKLASTQKNLRTSLLKEVAG